jgi:hypothetical protein
MAATIAVYQSMKDLPATAAAGTLVAVVRIASGKRTRAELFVFAGGQWVLTGQAIALEAF